MVVPTMIMTNPRPYPKIIPANHMEGPEGIKNTGKKASDATSTRARTGRPKAVASHCMSGKRTYSDIHKASDKNEVKMTRVPMNCSTQFFSFLLFLVTLDRI